MNKFTFLHTLLILFLGLGAAQAQTSNATIYGKITNQAGQPMEMVSVSLRDYPFNTASKRNGEYIFSIPSRRTIHVVFSFLGYEMVEKTLTLNSEEMLQLNIVMTEKSEQIDEVLITNRQPGSGNLTRIDPKIVGSVVGVSQGSIEGIIKTLPGVASSNELSNQYSVRGGSFDENLVYVNDIEIYRPFLIRSGQQEGLSFVNTDMVSGIEFSAGGFDAKFGDKMSSVLNITYNRPTSFKANISASLLGATAHVENTSKNQKFTYNMGVRYKTFQYLFGTLSEKGEYRPRFFDYQGYFTYTPAPSWELAFLGSVSSNQYTFVPQTRETAFGTWNNTKAYTVYFFGQEKDNYLTTNAAFSLSWQPTHNLFMKLIASGYQTTEAETFDIIGYYFLSETGRQPGTEEYGDSIATLGLGTYHEHGRNFIDAKVASLTYKGGVKLNQHYLQWGATYKNELINDNTKEWEFRDSAGYSMPFSPNEVELYKSSRSSFSIHEHRFSGYLQNAFLITTGIGELMLTTGVRAHYWTYNQKLSVSPRFSASLHWGANRDIQSRFSAGWYHQLAFSRELKDLSGNINPNIQTPRSFHVVTGTDYFFDAWDRPFKFTGELYYKALKNLIPYQYENVRIRYMSDKISDGFATGADFKINGEFVSGTQSWASMSIMGTYEDIAGDGHGYIPRPSDQRFKFSLFFQDYFPLDPDYQMNLTGHLITGTPYGPPKTERYMHTARLRSYRRIDIGFSRTLVSNGKNRVNGFPFFERFEELSVHLDIFNMIDIRNQSSVTWIADFEGIYSPVPNELTGRLFNLRISASF